MPHPHVLRSALLGIALAAAFSVSMSGVAPSRQSPPATPQKPQPPQPPAPVEQPAFKAGVEVVSLNVTVTDPAGHFVTNLPREAFSVYEDGVQQEVKFFNRSNLPVALSILLDTSASMEDKITTAQEAAVGFVRRLRAQDLGQVIDFDSRVVISQSFTASIPELETAIHKTTAGGSTSLHNAIYISLKELKKIQARDADDVRRQAIVVLSDGEDTSSLVSFDEVLDLAKRSETAIYAIGLRGRGPDHLRGTFNEADFVLRELSQETGGRVFFAHQASELAGMYSQISDELSSQYTVGYSSRNPKRDGAWRRVVVRIAQPSVTARTKLGYYAPTS